VHRHHRLVLFELPFSPEYLHLGDRHEAELAIASDLF
jgi:hypothetical protein